jgi:phage baseplate assembly protein W
MRGFGLPASGRVAGFTPSTRAFFPSAATARTTRTLPEIGDDVLAASDAIGAAASALADATGAPTTAQIATARTAIENARADLVDLLGEIDNLRPGHLIAYLQPEAILSATLWRLEARRAALRVIGDADDVLAQLAALLTGGGEVVYVVGEGDTLEDIARRLLGDHRAWVRIAERNGLSPGQPARGTSLTIPGTQTSATPTVTTLGDLDVPTNPDRALGITPDGDTAVITGRDERRRWIDRVLLVTPGSLVHAPDVGAGLENFLERPNSRDTWAAMARAAKKALERRADILEVVARVQGGVPGDDSRPHGSTLSIAYRQSDGTSVAEQLTVGRA